MGIAAGFIHGRKKTEETAQKIEKRSICSGIRIEWLVPRIQ
jgi:hypothetical protein